MPDEAGYLWENTQPVRDIRLVAMDLDGTLLRSDKNISKRCGAVIREVQAQGVKVVLATARPPRSVRSFAAVLGLDTLQIHYNGALIHDPHRSRHVFHQPMDLHLTREIIRQARRLDPQVVVSVEILDRWYTDHIDPTLPTETSVSFMPDCVGPLDAILQTPVTKLMLLAPPARLKPILDLVKQRFAGRVALAVSDQHLLQIMHPQVDKARALQWIATHYGVTREQTMAIGDAPNDLSMLTWAGLGVAVENAWPSVREKVREVVPSNDADGVAVALERYVLRG